MLSAHTPVLILGGIIISLLPSTTASLIADPLQKRDVYPGCPTPSCHVSSTIQYFPQCSTIPKVEYETKCHTKPEVGYETKCQTTPTTQYTKECHPTPEVGYVSHWQTITTTEYTTHCKPTPTSEYITQCRTTYTAETITQCHTTPMVEEIPCPKGKPPAIHTAQYPPSYPGPSGSYQPPVESECLCETTKYKTECETTCTTQYITPCTTLCSTHNKVHCEAESTVRYIPKCDPTPTTHYKPHCQITSVVDYVTPCHTKATTEYITKCQTTPTTHFETPCYTASTTQYTTSCPPPAPSEGPGIGISCSLVRSASAVYQKVLSLDTSSCLVSYYAQVLQMACLRSSPHCCVSECEEVNSMPHVIPPGCKEGEDLGGKFEEHVFNKLIQGSSFEDITARKEKVDSTIAILTKRIKKREIASPFLNYMFSLGAGKKVEKLVETYYSSVQLFGDLHPIFTKDIHDQLDTCDRGSVKEIVGKIGRTHSTLLKCGLGPSFVAQSFQDMNSTHHVRKRATTSTPKTFSPQEGTAASVFISLLGVQNKNQEMVNALQQQDQTDMSIEDIADALDAELPLASSLKPDPRNWVFSAPGSTARKRQAPTGNNENSESNAVGGSVEKDEISEETDYQADTTIEDKDGLISKLESDSDDDLNDSVVEVIIVEGEPAQPNPGNPQVVILPANADPSVEKDPAGAATNTRKRAILDQFPPGTGGALEPVAPTDADIGAVMYKSATLRIQVDPKFKEDPNIDPSKQLYIQDLVSGKELKTKYLLEKLNEDDESETEFLEAKLKFGEGIWAGGWGGGGAFEVKVKDLNA